MGEYLIIDGYNVINAWKDFAQLRQENLEHARELLVAGVAEYAAFKGYRAIVVFDAQEVAGAAASEKIHGIDVVFTDEGETADSWIERRAYELRRVQAKVSLSPVTTRSRLTFWEQVHTAFPPGNSASSIIRQKRKLPSVCMSPDEL